MAIEVTCPGCHQRFQVSDKFAGKKGPCPKCKAEIRIPEKDEDVVVHAPEQFGPKGKTGQAIFKPVARTEAKFSPVMAVAAAAGLVTVLVIAWLARGTPDEEVRPVLWLGAVVLAPPLVYAAYFFLHDDEYEPFRGRALYLRVAICSVVYAAIWGFYALIMTYLDLDYDHSMVVFIIPALLFLGALAAHTSLDLDFLSAALHYGVYLAATVLLRVMVLGAEHPF